MIEKIIFNEKEIKAQIGLLYFTLDANKLIYTELLGKDVNFENYKSKFASYITLYKQKKGEIEISVDSGKEETSKFLKDRLSISEETIEKLQLDGQGLFSLETSQFENVKNYNEDDFRKLSDFSQFMANVNYYLLLLLEHRIKE